MKKLDRLEIPSRYIREVSCEAKVGKASSRPGEKPDTHLYWCVDCKTPGCDQRLGLKYVGLASEWAGRHIPVSFPFPFQIRCRACHSVHNYTMPPDLQLRHWSHPPPLGFGDKF